MTLNVHELFSSTDTAIWWVNHLISFLCFTIPSFQLLVVRNEKVNAFRISGISETNWRCWKFAKNWQLPYGSTTLRAARSKQPRLLFSPRVEMMPGSRGWSEARLQELAPGQHPKEWCRNDLVFRCLSPVYDGYHFRTSPGTPQTWKSMIWWRQVKPDRGIDTTWSHKTVMKS